jgi:hypothetical protein
MSARTPLGWCKLVSCQIANDKNGQRLGGFSVAKTVVAADHLEWIILQELRKCADCPAGLSLAVVPDKRSWRIVVQKSGLSRAKLAFLRKLLETERRLQSKYALSG